MRGEARGCAVRLGLWRKVYVFNVRDVWYLAIIAAKLTGAKAGRMPGFVSPCLDQEYRCERRRRETLRKPRRAKNLWFQCQSIKTLNKLNDNRTELRN